jgi:predicted secreted protein
VVAQLALSAEKLAQAADQLTETTMQKFQERHQRQDETFKTLSESIAERTASEEHPEMAGGPDSTAPEQPAETVDDAKDE